MQQAEQAEACAREATTKFAVQAFKINVADDQIGLMGDAISDDRALDAGDDGLYVRLIEAENGGAVKRHAIDELHEDVLNFFERTILIEMFAVDGGDHGDDGRE